MRKYSDQEVIERIQEAPPSVREVVEDLTTVRTIATIGKNYGLHIDQIGVLAELNRNLLIGLVSPREFHRNLLEAGIPDSAARSIMAEINRKIFIPLRDKMQHSGISTPITTVPPPPPSYGERPPPPLPQEPFHSPQQVAAPASSQRERGEPPVPPRPATPPPLQEFGQVRLVQPPPPLQDRGPFRPSEIPEPSIPMPAPPAARGEPDRAPLPPLTILPGAAPQGSGAIIHNPWPAPPAGRGEPLPPPNLPTGTLPEKGTYTEPEGNFNTLPPLEKSQGTPPPEPPRAPTPPRSTDPYREPIE